MNRHFLIPVLLLCFGHTSCQRQGRGTFNAQQLPAAAAYTQTAELTDVIDGNTVELFVNGQYVWAHLDGVADTRVNEDILWEWFYYNQWVDVDVLAQPYFDEWVVYIYGLNETLERRW